MVLLRTDQVLKQVPGLRRDGLARGFAVEPYEAIAKSDGRIYQVPRRGIGT